MASVNHLESQTGSSSVSSHTSASFTPTADAVLVVAAFATFTSDVSNWAVSDSQGLTWTSRAATAEIQSSSTDTSGELWTAPVGASPVSMTVTVDYDATATGEMGFTVLEITDGNVSAPFAQINDSVTAGSGTEVDMTSPTLGSTPTSDLALAIFLADVSGTTTWDAAPANWSQVSGAAATAEFVVSNAITSTVNPTSVTTGFATSAMYGWCSFIAEIADAAPGSGSVVAVAADNTRLSAMDSTANTSNIGGGSGSGLETDFFYQGTGAISRKVSTALRGFAHDGGTAQNMTVTDREVMLVKAMATNYAALLAQSVPGMEVRIGSASGAYYIYDVAGNDTYPVLGGWLLLPIDPNLVNYRNGNSGSPTLTAVDYCGVAADFSATSKSENLVLDAVDVGAGLHLTGGDGLAVDGVFDDFVDEDEGTTGNRWGYVSTREDIVFVNGRLSLGENTSETAVATGFTDSGRVVVWNNGRFDAGYAKLRLNLGEADTDIDLSSCQLLGRGEASNTLGGLYTATGYDTRPQLEVTGTSGGASLDACTLDNWGTIDLTSGASVIGSTISDSDRIQVNGATFTRSTVTGSTAAAAVVIDNAAELGLVSDIDFVDNTGHSIEITALGTYNLYDLRFEGGGADATTTADVYVNVGSGTVTLNISGGTTPTVRTGGATVNIVLTNSLEITDLNNPSEVRVYDTGTTTEVAGSENVVTGTFLASVDAATYPVVDIMIVSLGYQIRRFTGFDMSTDRSIPASQQIDRQYENV